MTILVTGSSGFTGEVLIPKLQNLGYKVIGLDYKPGSFTKKINDISKPILLEEKIDVIIHLAARLEHDRCTSKEYYDTNVNGTRNILDLALKNNAFVIYVSTAAIYGSPNSPISEDAEILPNGDYAKTKWLGEKICEEYKTKGLEISTVRPSVLVGKKRLGIYKIIFKNLFKNSFLPILGDGSNKISFVDIEDFCGFLIFLMEKKIVNLIVNFGGKIPGTLNSVYDQLILHTNSTSNILHIPSSFLFFLKILSRLKIYKLLIGNYL